MDKARESPIDPFKGCPHHMAGCGSRSVSFRPRLTSLRPFNKRKSVRFRFKRRSPDAQSPTVGLNLSGGININCSSSSTVHGAEHHSCDPQPPIGGAAATFPEQLEVNDTGSVHSENDQDSPDSLCRNPKAVTTPHADLSQPAGKACDKSRKLQKCYRKGQFRWFRP